ncbi:MAG: hypothetical protein canaca05_00530 [Anaerolineaceae bacterium]|jgi:hypothetical protein
MDNETHKEIQIEWVIPEGVIARYASNVVVQKTESNYLISFFEIQPPLIIGNVEEINLNLSKIEKIEAKCVAQVYMSNEQIKAFYDLLHKMLDSEDEINQSVK